MSSLDIALVASLPDGDESLALAYLATALRQAGHHPHRITFRGYHDLEDAARRVCALRAPLLGLSIPSGHAAIDILALLHRVRSLGFEGHVTCGGAYATLARTRLLQQQAGLDSVVRHDGEVPIVGLADALAKREPLSQVAGLTTRHGDGAPAPVDDAAGMAMIPDRARTRLYAGVPCAKISAVRGCWGGCRYCGLAGLRREALREAGLRGLSCDAARRAGIGGMRRRPVHHVAEEMYRLYRDRAVRYFHFVDENHLPRDPQQACGVIAELEHALGQRGVGERALSLMLRADVATPEVVESLARLGVVRCLLGIESNTREGLAALGRGASVQVNQAAAQNLHRHGISFHLNILLIHPDSTIATIEQEVAALQRIEGGLIDPFQVELLEGTDLFERVRASGRLMGGPHLWHFWPQQPEARQFAEIFFALKREVMGRQQLTTYAYEVLGTLAVAGRLGHVGNARQRLAIDAHHWIVAHNHLWHELLEEAVRFARDPDPERQASFLRQGCVRAASVTLAFARLERDIERAAGGPLRTDVRYPRTGAAVALAASILAAACSGVASPDAHVATLPSALDGSVDAGANVPAAAAAFVDASADAMADRSSEAENDATADTATDSDADVAAEAEAAVQAKAPACDLPTARSEQYAVHQAARSCPDVCAPAAGRFQYRFTLNAAGRVIGMQREDGAPIPAAIKKCYLAATAGQVFPCLAKHQVWTPCFIALK